MNQDLQAKFEQLDTAFDTFTGWVNNDGALSYKTKILISLAIAVVKGCDSCVQSQTMKCIELGASDEEIIEACFVAVKMDGGPSQGRTRNWVLELLKDKQKGG